MDKIWEEMQSTEKWKKISPSEEVKKEVKKSETKDPKQDSIDLAKKALQKLKERGTEKSGLKKTIKYAGETKV